MLILPLHRPLTAANFPLMTALLIVFNVFVFVFLQSRDDEAWAAAQRYYELVDLGAIEVPAYQRYLQQRGAEPATTEDPDAAADGEPPRQLLLALHAQADVGFQQQLVLGQHFENEDEHQRWQQLRPRYDELRNQVFTQRHLLRSSEVDPWRMLSSAFLHGNGMHLVGNMLFLAFLGLLVEGALGPGRFLLLYLAGAVGASAVSLAWRWGEGGGGLGASGAVAALMGAYCVLWGRQPVRFFYWFFVVFDYVRAPAIWLLPAWLGWEVFNLLVNRDAGIGFDAHAGGLVTGALLAAALRRTGQWRPQFIEADDAVDEDDRQAEAERLLGLLKLPEAEALLRELAEEQPQDLDVALLRYRCARLGGQRMAAAARARDVLEAPSNTAARLQAQVTVLEDLQKHAQDALPAVRLRLIDALLAQDQIALAEAQLLRFDPAGGQRSALAQSWFQLALTLRAAGQGESANRHLRRLAAEFGDQPQGQKAQFLLAESRVSG